MPQGLQLVSGRDLIDAAEMRMIEMRSRCPLLCFGKGRARADELAGIRGNQ
jgi:hypothetical protein